MASFAKIAYHKNMINDKMAKSSRQKAAEKLGIQASTLDRCELIDREETEEEKMSSSAYSPNGRSAPFRSYILIAVPPLLSKQSPAFADVTRGNLRLLISGPSSSAGREMPDGRKPGPGGLNRFELVVVG